MSCCLLLATIAAGLLAVTLRAEPGAYRSPCPGCCSGVGCLPAVQAVAAPQVAVEARIVRVTEEFWQSHGGPTLLTRKTISDRDLFRCLEAVQCDRQANVMQAPKVTTLSGQNAAFSVSNEDHALQLQMRPTISADRRFVRLTAAVALHGPAGTEGDIAEVVIPDGRTLVMGGWTETAEERSEYGPPVLSRIPYLSRLFRNVGIRHQAYRVMVLVTPRVVAAETEEVRCCVAPRAAEAKPCEAEVLAALPAGERTNVRVVCEPVGSGDRMVGACRQQTVRWKCTVASTEVVKTSQPIAFRSRFPRVEVVYLEQEAVPVPAGGEETSEPAPRVNPRSDLLKRYDKACVENDHATAYRLALEALKQDPTCFAAAAENEAGENDGLSDLGQAVSVRGAWA